jgi:soluble lytic murein transglycosylase
MKTRRLGTVAAFVAVAILLAVVALGVDNATHKLQLPLSHARVIREQAAAKHIDPALVAAVIYIESRFEPRESSAGAEGLMQIEPATAYYLAHLSGGLRFTAGDLATPEVNIAYGTYYLRYLLDHYGGNVALALAAYNGGIANVDSWVARASAGGHSLEVGQIPFPETREYVHNVLAAEQIYRATYSRELGT